MSKVVAARARANLFGVAANATNLGVGETVSRASWGRYADPCYYTITKVKSSEGKGSRKVWGIKTWRGKSATTEGRVRGALKREWATVNVATWTEDYELREAEKQQKIDDALAAAAAEAAAEAAAAAAEAAEAEAGDAETE
jgi:hypothetical protein